VVAHGGDDLVPAHVGGSQHEVGYRPIAELGERPLMISARRRR
jgi:hypothetical protein